LFTTPNGVVIKSPVFSSLIIERSLGRVWWAEVPMAVCRRGFKCHVWLLDKHAKKSFAVFETAVFPGVPHEVSDHLA
jgi:hypothetical protein